MMGKSITNIREEGRGYIKLREGIVLRTTSRANSLTRNQVEAVFFKDGRIDQEQIF